MNDLNSIFQLANDILKQCDIVEVISSRIKVEKKGRSYVAVCPFHDDKNPSLMISKEKQIFKCFVCNTSGNAITFIQKYDKVSYLQAVKEVAKICGIHDARLDASTPKRKINTELENIYECLTAINNFYQACLFQSEDGKNALQYLYNRKLNDDVIRYFNIGYSTKDGINIINFLKAKGFSIKTIERTGIGHIRTSDMSIYDNNASRVIFPLKDINGQVVGFSARKINNNDDGPKYINTGTTEAFNKGTILYNLSNAEDGARKDGYIYLLEGFMDVIALYRVGIKNAVALMGTALTSDHVTLLKRLNCEIRICLDLDDPGQLNVLNLIEKFDENSINYRIVNPNVDFKEKDSDEILDKYGNDKLISFLNNLIDKPEWLISYYSKKLDLTNSSNKKKLIGKILPLMVETKSQYDIEDYLNRLSNLTGYSKQLIYENFKKIKANTQNDLNYDFEFDTQNDDLLKGIELVQFTIVKYMLENVDAIADYNSAHVFLPTLKYRNIVKLLNEYITNLSEKPISININEFISYININTEIEDKEEVTNAISDIVLNNSRLIPPYSMSEIKNQFKILEKIRLENKEKKDLEESIREASTPLEKAELYKLHLEKKKNKLK